MKYLISFVLKAGGLKLHDRSFNNTVKELSQLPQTKEELTKLEETITKELEFPGITKSVTILTISPLQ